VKAKSPGAAAAHRASDRDEIEPHVVSETSHSQKSRQVPFNATLVGSNLCSALGTTALGSAPVLALCCKLIEAGHDPASQLKVWRGDTLALTVHSIGEGAKLEASPRGVGFVRRPDVRGGSHITQNHRLPLWPDVDAP
jgi:hypothetical protein